MYPFIYPLSISLNLILPKVFRLNKKKTTSTTTTLVGHFGVFPPTIPRSRPCECSLKLCKNEWPPRADSSIVEEFGMGIPGMEVWIRQPRNRFKGLESKKRKNIII